MLLEYSITNYKSFKEESYLDLRPPLGKILGRYPGNFVKMRTDERVLKNAVIVGENAGGKSNLMESVLYFREMLTRNDLHACSRKSLVHAANQDAWSVGSDAAVQSFSAEIAFDDVTYTYSLQLDVWGVKEEFLEARRKRRGENDVIFRYSAEPQESIDDNGEGEEQEDDGVSLKCSLQYSKKSNLCEDDVTKMLESQDCFRGPVLVWLAAVGDAHCRKTLKWFTDDLILVSFGGVDSGLLTTAFDRQDLASIMASAEYLEIVRLVDDSIVEVRVDQERPELESILVRRDAAGRTLEREVKRDSAGVKGFVIWSYYLYKVIYQGKTVLADEIDSAINPVLSERIIALLNGTNHAGQFVFTTHNIFNLTLRNFMKEQIYFVTKDPMTLESSLYSAADFDEIRYDVKEELYEFYFRGMLGGTVNG